MGKFALGVLLGALLGAGGVYLGMTLGTKEAAEVAKVETPPDAGPPAKAGKKKPVRSGRRGGGGGGGDFGDEPIPTLTASDLAIRAQGDSLRPRPREVDLGEGGAEVRDLDQSEIDGGFRPAASGITDCITEARGPAPVTGRIEVGLVVDPAGKVIKTRVEAPGYLLDNGLYRCVRREVTSLRFPATGKDSVITVPFDLS